MLSAFHALSFDYFAEFTPEIEKIVTLRPSETHSRIWRCYLLIADIAMPLVCSIKFKR